MFTKETYHEYFKEIYNKEKEMIFSLRTALHEISDDHMSKALTWHMRRDIRHAVLLKGLIRSLSVDAKAGHGPIDANGIDADKFDETVKKGLGLRF